MSYAVMEAGSGQPAGVSGLGALRCLQALRHFACVSRSLCIAEEVCLSCVEGGLHMHTAVCHADVPTPDAASGSGSSVNILGTPRILLLQGAG